jgi:hypothetical protein
VGALAAWGVAEGDWASVWQAVIVDLFSGGAVAVGIGDQAAEWFFTVRAVETD